MNRIDRMGVGVCMTGTDRMDRIGEGMDVAASCLSC